MLKHIVMWTLKPHAMDSSAAENAATMKAMLEALRGRIPGLLNLEVAMNIVAAQPGCDIALYSEFPDQAALDAYQVHPEHQKCLPFIKQVVSERRVLDYII